MFVKPGRDGQFLVEGHAPQYQRSVMVARGQSASIGRVCHSKRIGCAIESAEFDNGTNLDRVQYIASFKVQQNQSVFFWFRYVGDSCTVR